jgi:hypothetical protein
LQARSSSSIVSRSSNATSDRAQAVKERTHGETLVVVDGAVADDLDLRLAGDRLEVGVEDRLGLAARLVIAVAVGLSKERKGSSAGALKRKAEPRERERRTSEVGSNAC